MPRGLLFIGLFVELLLVLKYMQQCAGQLELGQLVRIRIAASKGVHFRNKHHTSPVFNRMLPSTYCGLAPQKNSW